MTMISRLEIITTSISPSTTSMITVSDGVFIVAVACPGGVVAIRICCIAAWLPKAASTRCVSSTQNSQT